VLLACTHAVVGGGGRGGRWTSLAEVATEWPGGSAQWAQSATPREEAQAPPLRAGVASGGAATGTGDRWAAWADSQSFIPSRLTEPPAGGRGAAGREAAGRGAAAGLSTRADDDPLVRDAQALIKKAAGANAEDLMRGEAAALEPMYFRQSGAQRLRRAEAAAEAAALAAERARQRELRAAAAAAAREKELGAQGIVRKERTGDDDDVEADGDEPDSAQVAAREDERIRSYRAKGFSPTRRDFAGAGASWGFEPAGYQPLDVFGWRVQPRAGAPPAARDDAAAPPSAAGFVPKELWRGGIIEQPADAPAAASAAATQWGRSRRAAAAAATAAAQAARDLPFRSQAFPAWARDANLGWGDEAVGYLPRERDRRAEEAVAADAAARAQEFAQQGFYVEE